MLTKTETNGRVKVKVKQLLPFAIYVFEKDDTIYACSRVVKDGMDEIYGQGFSLEPDQNSRLNQPSQIRRRARKSVVNAVSNMLNAINIYGKEILDYNGNINYEKFEVKEIESAVTATKLGVNMNLLKQAHTFKQIDIDEKTAHQYNLI